MWYELGGVVFNSNILWFKFKIRGAIFPRFKDVERKTPTSEMRGVMATAQEHHAARKLMLESRPFRALLAKSSETEPGVVATASSKLQTVVACARTAWHRYRVLYVENPDFLALRVSLPHQAMTSIILPHHKRLHWFSVPWEY